MIYHIPCENDASARETARTLSEKGYDCYPALSFHPFATPFVVVLVQEGQDQEPLVARGGKVIASTPLHPAPENDHHDHPHDQFPQEYLAGVEVEEETEPDDEPQPTTGQ